MDWYRKHTHKKSISFLAEITPLSSKYVYQPTHVIPYSIVVFETKKRQLESAIPYTDTSNQAKPAEITINKISAIKYLYSSGNRRRSTFFYN